MNFIELIGGGAHSQSPLNLDPNNTPQPVGSSRLTEKEAFGKKQCSNCGRDGSTLWCQGCKVSEVGQLRVFYCSVTCQEAHWPSHKATCKARRQLGRSVSILEEIWTAFETATYVARAKFLEKRGNVIVQENLNDDYTRHRAMTGGSVFNRFPDVIFPNNIEEDTIKAMVFRSDCEKLLDIGMPLIKLLLHPVRRVEEVDVQVKNLALLVLVQGYENPLPYFHGLIRLTLTNGEVFALDLTSAKYGWKESLFLWDKYQEFRVHHIYPEPMFETGDWAIMQGLHRLPEESPLRGGHRIRSAVLTGLLTNLEVYLDEGGLGVAEMLDLPENNYADVRRALCTFWKSTLDEWLHELLQSGIGRLYYNALGLSSVALTDGDAEMHRDIWLTEEEVEEVDGDLDLMEEVWVEKVQMQLMG